MPGHSYAILDLYRDLLQVALPEQNNQPETKRGALRTAELCPEDKKHNMQIQQSEQNLRCKRKSVCEEFQRNGGQGLGQQRTEKRQRIAEGTGSSDSVGGEPA